MRKIITFSLCLLLAATAFSQSPYDTTRENDGTKILKGLLTRENLQNDTSFKWYAQNTKPYTPNSTGLAALKQYGDSLRLIVFMGTWCEDSHFVIPRLFLLLDQAGFSRDKITLIGVDRDKKTLSHLTEALNIVNVPTIMIMKNGKELGRVVEYGHDGLFDKEMGEILQ